MKYSKYAVCISSFVILVTAVLVTGFSNVHGVTMASDTPLDDKFGQLLDSQNQLTDTLTKILIQGEELNPPKPQNYVAGANSPAPQCYDDYLTWNSSATYKQSPWDVTFAVFPNTGTTSVLSGHNLFIDLNGDGLADYLYMGPEYSTTKRNACVYLNTGSGWNRVYKCVEQTAGNGTWTFYGDCAQ